MADSYIQVAPDSTGKKLQTYENSISGQTVEAEAVVLVDATGTPITLMPNISDAAFGSSWDGDTTVAPSKNAVYDELHKIDSADDGTIVNAGTGFRIAAAAASRKILVGNGTNFVASTETYATPGTAGQVLTSDGTNWVSSAPTSPINNQNGTYTTVLADSGKTIVHTSGSAHTHTIDSNANVAYPVGTVISFINVGSGVLSIAITSDTLNRGDGTAGTGTRTLAASSVATAIKTDTTVWWINGKFAS